MVKCKVYVKDTKKEFALIIIPETSTLTIEGIELKSEVKQVHYKGEFDLPLDFLYAIDPDYKEDENPQWSYIYFGELRIMVEVETEK